MHHLEKVEVVAKCAPGRPACAIEERASSPTAWGFRSITCETRRGRFVIVLSLRRGVDKGGAGCRGVPPTRLRFFRVMLILQK